MKTLTSTLMFGIILSLNFLYAQENQQIPPEGSYLNSLLVNIDKSSVTSGIIYERKTQFANLYNFNKRDAFDTAEC